MQTGTAAHYAPAPFASLPKLNSLLDHTSQTSSANSDEGTPNPQTPITSPFILNSSLFENLNKQPTLIDPNLPRASLGYDVKPDPSCDGLRPRRQDQLPQLYPSIGDTIIGHVDLGPLASPSSPLRSPELYSFKVLVAAGNIESSICDALRVPEDATELTMVENVYLDSIPSSPRNGSRSTRPFLSTSETRFFIHETTKRPLTIMTAAKLLYECCYQTSLAVSDKGGIEHHTPLDSAVYLGNLSSKRSGIPAQRMPPPGSVPNPQLKSYITAWGANKSKTESHFRLNDEQGNSFNLEELQEAVRILTSRPPRRINYYPAPEVNKSTRTAAYTNSDAVAGDATNELTSERPSSRAMRHFYNAMPRPTCKDLVVTSISIDRDLVYRPTYVQGRGVTKLAWCDYCPRGGFHKVKNSGYLYHMNHEHGIFANNNVFEDPLAISRKSDTEAKWTGLCGICYRWIDLDQRGENKWGTWFRHYNQCTKEYDELKNAILRTGATVEFIEIEYNPWVPGPM